MTDETPQNPREGLPPVRMALRVIGRHGHRGGPHLARAVAGARAPKHLGAEPAGRSEARGLAAQAHGRAGGAGRALAVGCRFVSHVGQPS